MQYTLRYTSSAILPAPHPDMPSSSSPITLPQWQAAYASGADARQNLLEVGRRIASSGASGIWITRTDAAGLDAQIGALEARAAACGRRTAALEAMPLFGVPFAVKDNIDVAGLPTTAACPAIARTPSAHATVIARLVAAGAVCMGKTNLDQFATGLVGTRSPYGRPSSALASDRISGGSSSGSAVAVARGDVAFALGTDTAGSGRVPAAFNNIVGLKPTPGRVSTHGVLPACRSIDCVSVLALTVADAARVLSVIEGDDAADAYSAFEFGPARWPGRLRVGIDTAPVFTGHCGYAAAHECAVAQLESLGHEVVAIDGSPLQSVAQLLYGGPWVAERHAVVEALLQAQPEAFDPSVREVIAKALDFSATDAFRGFYALQEARRHMHDIWTRIDVLMLPSAPGHPTFDEVDADPIGVNAGLGRYTNFVNLLGWCALAVPAGFTDSELPFGVTFIAPAAHDAALARFGMTWQRSLDLRLGATEERVEPAPEPSKPAPAGAANAATASEPEPAGAAPAVAASAPPQHWPASVATLPIAVVGAHLSGMPLNTQLVERGATLRAATQTAAAYRLFALPHTHPAKPGLVRNALRGAAIAVEVWDMPLDTVGSFLASIPAPLGLGNVELEDGTWVHGFLCESHAVEDARDVTSFGGWRAFVER